MRKIEDIAHLLLSLEKSLNGEPNRIDRTISRCEWMTQDHHREEKFFIPSTSNEEFSLYLRWVKLGGLHVKTLSDSVDIALEAYAELIESLPTLAVYVTENDERNHEGRDSQVPRYGHQEQVTLEWKEFMVESVFKDVTASLSLTRHAIDAASAHQKPKQSTETQLLKAEVSQLRAELLALSTEVQQLKAKQAEIETPESQHKTRLFGQ